MTLLDCNADLLFFHAIPAGDIFLFSSFFSALSSFFVVVPELSTAVADGAYLQKI